MSKPSSLEGIFFAALEKKTPTERAAFLDAACGTDRELRRKIEGMLAAHPLIASFLQSAPSVQAAHPASQKPAAYAEEAEESTASFLGLAEAVGMVLGGKYKLLQLIGQGGMGAVFMAEQTEPVRRMVAVKLIKPGMDSKQVLARFSNEQQALAIMDHPNIAKVLDAGTTDAGSPFFVMELVKGIPITRFCDERKLTPRQRLEMFIPVCQAVHHAHQKGIIHRDLKPSNVLIALYDGVPVPKVIDFGVAKATGQKLTDMTLFTGFGAIVGTPEYMAPEQAELNQLDIDTRSDIYSLGVLLYELLTGSPPFDRKRFRAAALLEMLRIVREEEPPKPSTRLSTSDALPSIAANRQTDPIKLTRLVRGELDWIVMKALEKDRNRRYETAKDFASDIQRYLVNEPVLARAPQAGYLLRKFVGKHRGGLAAATAIFLILIAGILVSTWQAFRANEAAQTARAAELQALADRAVAIDAREAETRAKQSAQELATAEAKAKNEAVQERDRATKAAFESRRANATGQILLAQAAWREGKAEIARQHLNRVPPEFRNIEWRYLKREYQGGLFVLAGHKGPVNDAAFSPDGRLIATAGDDKTLRLWDARTGRLLAELKGHSEKVATLAFSTDGRTLASGGFDNAVRIWDLQTRTCLRVLKGHSASIVRIAYSPNSHFLACASNDQTATIWHLSSGLIVKRLPCKTQQGAGPFAIDWAPSENVVAMSDWDSNITIWDSGNAQQLRSIRGLDQALGLRFGADGSLLFTTNYRGEVEIWNWKTGAKIKHLEPSARESSFSWHAEGRRAAISPDETLLATGRYDGGCTLWDLRTDKVIRDFTGHGAEVYSVAFSPDGELLLSASADGTARVWSIRRTNLPASLEGVIQFGDQNVERITGDGRFVVTVNYSDMTRDLRETFTGRIISRFPTSGYGMSQISPNGAWVLTQREDGGDLWNAKTGKRIKHFSGKNGISGQNFSSDSNWLVAVSKDEIEKIAVWNTIHAEIAAQWTLVRKDGILCVAISPDNKSLAILFRDGCLQLCDMLTGQGARTLSANCGGYTSIIFNKAGDKVLLSSVGGFGFTGDAVLASVTDGEIVARFQTGDQTVRAFFSQDESRLLVGNANGLVRIFDTTSQDLLSVITLGSSATLRDIALLSDGGLVVSDGRGLVTLKPDPDFENIGTEYRAEDYARIYEVTEPAPEWHTEKLNEFIGGSRWFAAAVHARQLLRVQPFSAEIIVRLGHIHRLARQPQLAALYFVQACLIDPHVAFYPKDWAYIFSGLGSKAAERKDWPEAIRQYQDALACDPDCNAWQELAMVYLSLGQNEKVQKALQQVLQYGVKLAANNSYSETLLGQAYTCLVIPLPAAQTERLVTCAGAVAKHTLWIGDMSSKAILGGALYRAGRYPEARRELLEAVAEENKSSKTATARVFLAMTENQLGNKAAAKEFLTEADQIFRDKGDTQAWTWTAKIWWQTVRKEAEDLVFGKK